jgi:SHS2 domain-containing protein
VGRWRVVEDVAIADVALEIEGADLADLMATAAQALADLMVDPATLPATVERTVTLEAPSPDLLLHDWLGELIFRKDRDAEVFPRTDVRVEGGGPLRLTARLTGGTIDPDRTERRADPKAVTFHRFVVEPTAGGWRAAVVIDV